MSKTGPSRVQGAGVFLFVFTIFYLSSLNERLGKGRREPQEKTVLITFHEGLTKWVSRSLSFSSSFCLPLVYIHTVLRQSGLFFMNWVPRKDDRIE